MKAFALTFVALFSLNTFAFAPSYDGRPELNIVMGVDKNAFPDESPLRFPCTSTLGKVSCGQIKFENKVCERTFFVSRFVNKLELSCLINLRKVVIGYADARYYTPGTSRDQFGFYAVTFTRNVSLKRDTSANTIFSVKP